MRATVLSVLLPAQAAFLVLAGSAAAQTVSAVTVFAGDPPKIAATYPAQDQAVAPGVLVLKATFDQKMLLSGFDYGPVAGTEPLECVKTPRLLNDDKTFVLLCRAWPGKTYGVAFNAAQGAAHATGFANQGELRAAPSTLTFTTTSGEPIRTVAAGVKAAGLEPTDTPIQETSNIAPAAPVAPPASGSSALHAPAR